MEAPDGLKGPIGIWHLASYTYKEEFKVIAGADRNISAVAYPPHHECDMVTTDGHCITLKGRTADELVSNVYRTLNARPFDS